MGRGGHGRAGGEGCGGATPKVLMPSGCVTNENRSRAMNAKISHQGEGNVLVRPYLSSPPASCVFLITVKASHVP